MNNPNTLTQKLPAAAVALALGATLAGCTSEKAPDVSPTAAPSTAVEEPDTHTPINPKLTKASGTILFAAGLKEDHDIYLQDLKTGKTTNLTSTPGVDELNPQPSPDHKTVLFAGNKTGNYEIYSFPLSKPTEIKRLTNDEGRDDDPVWSPSGKQIFFKTTRYDKFGDIAVVDKNGGKVGNLTPDRDNKEDWNPKAITDTQIVFTTRHPDDGPSREELDKTDELVLLDTTTGEIKHLTDNDYPDRFAAPKDNKPGIIAYSSKDPSDPKGSDIIYQMNVNAPKPETTKKELTALPGDNDDPAWVGDKLLFVNKGQSGKFQAHVLTKNGDTPMVAGYEDQDVLSPVGINTLSIE